MTNQELETKQWLEQAAPGATVQVGTERIVVDTVTGKLTTEPVKHWSDCAVHSEPAYPAGPCDCGAGWQNLTIEEINEVLGSDIHDEPSGILEFVRAIEMKLKEKNT